MSQTSTIFFFVIIGWIVYITTKGELPKYLAVLFGTATPAPVPQQQSADNSAQTADTVVTALSVLGF